MEQPNETLPRDVVLSGANNVRINFWGAPSPLKIWGSEERPKLGVI